MPRKYGYLSELQFKVLRFRIVKGLSHKKIANILGTTRENVTIIERRARRNIKLAEETLQAYRLLFSMANIRIEVGTHLIDVPGILVKAGDTSGIKLKVNFTRIYDEIRFKAEDCISGSRVVKPFTIAIFRDGSIEVMPKL
ncbi:MAG: Tfx family DNA-binding protein [Candidatus Odinarchaeia archaeon]